MIKFRYFFSNNLINLLFPSIHIKNQYEDTFHFLRFY